MSCLAHFGTALVLGLCLAPPTGEPGPQADAALGPSFAATIPAHERDSIRAAFERDLARACADLAVCTQAPCEAEGSRIGVEIDGRSRHYGLRWTVEDPRLEAPMSVEQGCELCSLRELDELIAAELARTCTRLAALDQAPAHLRIDSEPRGAKLWIDGEEVGRTPWVAELPAGVHELELRAPGHKQQQRSVELFASEEQRARIELVPEAPPARSTRRPHAPGWVGVGVGLSLGIAGAVLLGIDGAPWRGRCSGADVDALGNCRFVYTTAPLGAGLASAGAGLLGAGVGLVIWARRPVAGPQAASVGAALRLRF